MKSPFVLLFPLLLIIFNLSLFAQQPKFFGQASVGTTIPAIESKFPDSYNVGFHFGAGGGNYLSEFILLRGCVFYNNLSGKNLPAGMKSTMHLVTISGDVLFGDFKKTSQINPYGFAGISSYVIGIETSSPYFNTSSSDTKIGFQLGGGALYKLSTNYAIYAEASFNYIFNNGYVKGYLPIHIGINYQF